MSGTVCCYSGCKKSYSKDKDVAFFKFPDEEKRRKKWMQNCGNQELESLSERQLRGKRICSDHFPQNSFLRPQSRSELNNSAVPLRSKVDGTPTAVKESPKSTPPPPAPKVTPKAAKSTTPAGKAVGGRGRAQSPVVEASPPPPTRGRGRRKASPEIETPPPVTPARGVGRQKKEATPAKKAEEETAKQPPAETPVEPSTPSPPTPKVTPKAAKSTTPAGKAVGVRGKAQSPAVEASTPPPPATQMTPKEAKAATPAGKAVVGRGKAQSPAVEASTPPPPATKMTPKAAKATIPGGKTVGGRGKAQAQSPAVEASTPPPPATKMTPKTAKATTPAGKAVETSLPPPTRGRGKRKASPEIETPPPVTPSGVDRPKKEANPAKKSKTEKQSPASEETPVVVARKSAPVENVAVETKSTRKLKLVSEITTSPTTTDLTEQKKDPEDNDNDDNMSEGGDSFDEYTYFDREFDFEQEQEEDRKADREFERFHIALKKCLQLPGKWTMGSVTWDPQGKRKVIIISEPEIPPTGRPILKRYLQCFEDKSIRVFIDQMDMTDVFGMSCYSEKEDVAGLIARVADASSCCGVPEMVVDDLAYFPNVRKRNTSFFDPNCPGVIPNDAYDPICTACKDLQSRVLENRENEKRRLYERRIRSEEKQFQHPFGEALYNLLNDLADETDPTKPKKKRTKETFFRKFLHDTRFKLDGDSARTERVYIEKPISVDSVSQSFQDIVSKLGFNMPNAKKRPPGGLLPKPTSTSTPRPRIFGPGGTSNLLKLGRSMDHILPFTPGSSFTLDDGVEYELIGEVEPGPEVVEMKPSVSQQQYEIIEVDDETLARLASTKNQVVMLPDSVPSLPIIPTRIDANDPNLSQILKAINTSHSFKIS